MNAKDALNRFIDSRLANYPYGISKSLLEQMRSEKEQEERLLLLINKGDSDLHKQLIEAIITKGLKLNSNQVEIIEASDNAPEELSMFLESGRRIIACLGSAAKNAPAHQNLCLSFSLQEIASEIEKKREFWNSLQKFMSLI